MLGCSENFVDIIFIILIIFIKPAAHAQVGNTKLLISYFCKLTSILRHGNERKYNSGKRLTAPLNPSCVPVSNIVKGRAFHIRTWAGRKHFANWDVLHLDPSNSNGWAAAAVRVCRTLVDADRSSLNRLWLEFESLYNFASLLFTFPHFFTIHFSPLRFPHLGLC